MNDGWQERHGDFLALLRGTVVCAGMNPPRGGIQIAQLHPYPAIAIKRRRKLMELSGEDGWDKFDAAMQRYVQQGSD